VLRSGRVRYLVEYRLGGRESAARHAGSFRTRREAELRRAYVAAELAALRVPDLRRLERPAPSAPTVAEACDRWRASRIDVADSTRVLHRVALARVVRVLGRERIDELTADHVQHLVEALAADGKRRETIRKSLKYLAAVLDYHGIQPNPARDRLRIRLPREEPEEINPPTASAVEAVYRLLAPPYRLPLLWLDWSGARVSSVDTLRVGDYDERHRRLRLRAATQKTRRALWVDLPDVLAEAIERKLGPREDRDPEARIFAGVTADNLRMAIIRACRAAGVPVFSPHDLRHRRISLLHRQGRSWAEIARFVGQRKLSVTADTYTHVLLDPAEVDYAALLAGPG
jgi:integrase